MLGLLIRQKILICFTIDTSNRMKVYSFFFCFVSICLLLSSVPACQIHCGPGSWQLEACISSEEEKEFKSQKGPKYGSQNSGSTPWSGGAASREPILRSELEAIRRTVGVLDGSNRYTEKHNSTRNQ